MADPPFIAGDIPDARSAAPGSAYLRFSQVRSRTVLERAFAASPLRLLSPHASDEACWVYLSTYGGGLVGGDAIHVTIDVQPGGRALLATQPSTKR